MKEHRLRAYLLNRAECSRCLHTLDAHSLNLNDPQLGRPQPGDFSICAHCGQFNVFDDDLDLRAATDDELAELRAFKVDDTLEDLFARKFAGFGITVRCSRCHAELGAALSWGKICTGWSYREPAALDGPTVSDSCPLRPPGGAKP